MGIARVLAFGSALLAAASSVAAQPVRCHGALKARQVAELMFGRDIGGTVGVSEAAWARFVETEMTPRFPDGLTITDAIGQWRDRHNGTIVREPSKRVEIVLPGHDDDTRRLQAIVAAYKRLFHQQSVGLIVQSACVQF